MFAGERIVSLPRKLPKQFSHKVFSFLLFVAGNAVASDKKLFVFGVIHASDNIHILVL